MWLNTYTAYFQQERAMHAMPDSLKIMSDYTLFVILSDAIQGFIKSSVQALQSSIIVPTY